MANKEQLDHFSALSEKCIVKIFEWLPLESLCNISRTCKKLNKVAGDHFHQKYPELVIQEIVITEDDNGKLIFEEESKKYMKCFSKYFERVRLEQCRLDDRLVRFMQKKCSKQLKYIDIFSCKWPEMVGEGILNILASIETIKFEFLCGDRIPRLDDTLKHCLQMKHLQIEVTNFNKQVRNLPRKSHPMLETYQLQVLQWDYVDFNELASFFKRNQNVKRFICGADSDGALKRMLRVIVEKSNIEELFLSIDGPKLADDDCLHGLKALTDRDNFKRIELKVHGRDDLEELAQLSSPLQKVAGLHLQFIKMERSLTELQAFANLKVLSMEKCKVTKKAVDGMARGLRNIEELHFCFPESIGWQDCVKPFVQHSQKLSTLVFQGPATTNRETNISELSLLRQNLDAACKLTIYLAEYSTFLRQHLRASMVDIEVVSMEWIPGFDPTNPFIDHPTSYLSILSKRFK